MRGEAMNREELVPPGDMIFVGGGDFAAIGREFFRYFVEIGGLKPHHRVLDVGCGIGRMAVPLTRYINSKGSYDGFDIVPMGIDWCRDHITPHYPNFRFQRADIFNQSYNPEGRFKGSEYRFPYRSKSFDFIFLTSVFTHMMPADLENYVEEIARVLKVNGTFFGTFYLLNDTSLGLIQAKESSLQFPYGLGPCRYEVESIPEDIVGFDETFVRGLYEACGLQMREPLSYGSWCGRDRFVSGQDIVVATKCKHVAKMSLGDLGATALRKLVGLFRKPPVPVPVSPEPGQSNAEMLHRHVAGRNQELAQRAKHGT
jgi:SAM-dependent methyltransferase